MSGLWVGLGALAKLQLFCKLGFCALALCGLQMCCNVQWVVDVFVRQLIFARSLVGVADNTQIYEYIVKLNKILIH